MDDICQIVPRWRGQGVEKTTNTAPTQVIYSPKTIQLLAIARSIRLGIF
jgi:hypothetical protein